MSMYNPPYALWSIWSACSGLQKLFVALLCGVGISCLLSALVTIKRLRSLRTSSSNQNIASAKASISALRDLWAQIGQVVGATFYLFGVVLCLGLQTVGRTLGDSTLASWANQVIGGFTLHCAFAANVFFIFLVLHLVQWFVHFRLNSFTKRMHPDPLDDVPILN